MRTFLTRLALVSMFLMSLLAAGSAAALADPGNGNGAVTSGGGGPFFDGTACTDLGNGLIDCFVIKGEQRTTLTPSGNYIFQVNNSGTDTLYYNGQAVSQDKFTGHWQETVTQINTEVHGSTSDTITYNGQTYCTAWRFHWLNGQFQFDNYGPC